MSWPRRASAGPIGIDVGRRGVKATQFSRSSAGWRVVASAAVPRTRPEPIIDRSEVRHLRDVLARRAFRGRSIVLAVPPDLLLTGIMELPPRGSGAPLEQLARQELARMHNCEPDSIEVACWDLPAPARAANTTFVMAVGCRHDDANGLLDAFEEEGFDVEALEVHACAAARACRRMLEQVSGLAGILDVGWASAHLVLMYHNVVVYERRLTKGGLGALVRALEQELGLGPEATERLLRQGGVWQAGGTGLAAGGEAAGFAADACFASMVEEMRIPLSYLANQYPEAALERLLLIGGGATLPGLRDYLASGLDVDVQVVRPTDLAACPESLDADYGPALALAIGLAQSDGT